MCSLSQFIHVSEQAPKHPSKHPTSDIQHPLRDIIHYRRDIHRSPTNDFHSMFSAFVLSLSSSTPCVRTKPQNIPENHFVDHFLLFRESISRFHPFCCCNLVDNNQQQQIYNSIKINTLVL